MPRTVSLHTAKIRPVKASASDPTRSVRSQPVSEEETSPRKTIWFCPGRIVVVVVGGIVEVDVVELEVVVVRRRVVVVGAIVVVVVEVGIDGAAGTQLLRAKSPIKAIGNIKNRARLIFIAAAFLNVDFAVAHRSSHGWFLVHLEPRLCPTPPVSSHS